MNNDEQTNFFNPIRKPFKRKPAQSSPDDSWTGVDAGGSGKREDDGAGKSAGIYGVL